MAAEFAKSHGERVAEVMSEDVIAATEDMPLSEIAALLERNRVKRVPIVRDGELVGIVSRSNLVQAMASNGGAPNESLDASRTIRAELLSRLEHEQSWTDFGSRNVIVSDGKVHLWGLISSDAERRALIALAEGVPGVTQVIDGTIPGLFGRLASVDTTHYRRAYWIARLSRATTSIGSAQSPRRHQGEAAIAISRTSGSAQSAARKRFHSSSETCSGNMPGIQRAARAAGNANRNASGVLSMRARHASSAPRRCAGHAAM